MYYEAVAFLEGLLQQVVGGAADVSLGSSGLERVVRGAAVEALAHAAAPPAPDAAAPAGGKVGKVSGAGGGANAAAAALAARLHAPLLALAGASRAGGRQQGKKLVMALETAGMSTGGQGCSNRLWGRFTGPYAQRRQRASGCACGGGYGARQRRPAGALSLRQG